MLIKALNSADNFHNSSLDVILQRISIIVKEFDNVESFHILWDLKKLADSLDNKACLLPQGILSIDSIDEESNYFHPIPEFCSFHM